MGIEDEVLEEIRPKAETVSEINGIADRLMAETRRYISEHDLDVEAMFVGSFAKGTFLSNPDLDLFLMFPESESMDDLVEVTFEMGKLIINGQKLYAEHPYMSGFYEGIEVDMVPCYRIATTEKLKSSVDRSPFHFRYITSKADSAMCDQIRLMKKFMKGIGTYGAEPNVRGFSGYMCELITLYYGGFMNAVKAASEWKAGTTLAPEKKGPMMDAPLVLYDPVDSSRNVASAVHIDTLCEFIYACRSYLAQPSRKFFFPEKREPMDRNILSERAEMRGTRLLAMVFENPQINEDNLHAQIWRTQYAVQKKLDLFSFNTVRAVHSVSGEEIVILFELESDRLSATHRHVGPPVWVASGGSFLDKWKDNPCGAPYIEDGRWTVVSDRLYSSAEEMVRKEAPIAGIGKNMDTDSMRIIGHDGVLKEIDAMLLTELLDPRHRWEL